MLEASGRYFSEHMGSISDEELTLAAVIEGEEGARANINPPDSFAGSRSDRRRYDGVRSH